MSENKSNKSMRDKLALITYLSTNPHIILDGVELISKGAKLASECSEFVARIKQAGNTSVLFNLIKNKEDENKEQTVLKNEVKIDNSFYYAYEDKNTVVASVVIPQEALQAFKKLDISEDLLNNRINSDVITKSNFEWFDGRIINNKQYKSILEANNYLGNKLTLQVDSVVTEDYANGQVYIQLETKLYNPKNKEKYIQRIDKIPFDTTNMALPKSVEHYINITEAGDLVANFKYLI